MTRTVTTTVHCYECVTRRLQYTNNETGAEVLADLRRRGWLLNREDRDVCPYCAKELVRRRTGRRP